MNKLKLKERYALKTWQIGLMIFQMLMTFFCIFLCGVRFSTELSVFGYVDCTVTLLALLGVVWYIFVGYKKGEIAFDAILLTYSAVLLTSTVMSTVSSNPSPLVALSMVSFAIAILVAYMRRTEKLRFTLIIALSLIELTIFALALFFYGKPGALVNNNDFLGFASNIYMIARFVMAEMIALCYFAHERKIITE